MAQVPKPKKRKGVRDLKKELDFIFSWWIRLKDSVNGRVPCYTCYKVFDVIDIQAGHYWSRSNSIIRWDESNVKPQCSNCNCSIYGGGKQQEFALHLVKEHGGEVLIRLENKKKISAKLNPGILEELIKGYTNQVKDFMSRHGEKVVISKKLQKYLEAH